MPPVAILVCIVIALSLLQQASPRIGSHPLVFLGFNLIFLALVVQPQALAFLAAFLAVNYLLAAAARRCPAVHMSVFVATTIVMFAIFKKYDILPLQALYAHIPEILGLSYVVFRVLNIIIDVRDADKLPGIVSYLNFCLSMVTFLSGPIQRYRAFSEDMERRRDFRLDEKEGALALTRLMNGIIEVIFLAPLAQGAQDFFMLARLQGQTLTDTTGAVATFHGPMEHLGDLAPSFCFGLAALCYLVFLYLNFGGYTNMMIGLGRLLGFRLPENFDNPFVATSFLDFWKRWHISLSLWFRDYCFMPAWSATRAPALKSMMLLGVNDPAIAVLPAYFISFGLLGLWHGRTWPFILCGLMFAIGSSANHLWRSYLSRRANSNVSGQTVRGPLYQSFASALTLFYISVAVTGLWLPEARFTKVLHSFSIRQASVSFALIVVGLTGVLYFGRALLKIEKVQSGTIRRMHYFFEEGTPFLLATKIFLVVAWFFTLSTNLPAFVYQGF